MEVLPLHRPGSIRSVASNSSLASGVSLSRRSRTKTRSRTHTGGSRTHDDASRSRSPLPPNSPYFGENIVHEPSDVLDASAHDGALSTPPPSRPPRSPQRLETQPLDLRSSDTASSLADPTFVEPSLVEPTQSTAFSARPVPSKAANKASSLPHLDTGYRQPHSAFSRDPALTPVVNVRDSVSTQQSGVSSSLYPPSTATSASAPESPTSPQSMAAAEIEAPPFALEVNEVQEYDSDDVSYRLRLLVKNNYFLPPAHSKPSAADFAPPVDLAKKPSPTTFLDIFRKSKSKPTTPTGTNFNSMAPMLRTTSDSITAPYAFRQPPHPQNAPHPTSNNHHRPSPPLSAPPSRGRVVVVREKMHDISLAAKQAEKDLKSRSTRLDPASHSQHTHPTLDASAIIDPTDAVDIPLPSPSYPFPVQASALHGLGVLESLGAAVLADHLPPAKEKNPNLSVEYDEAEDSWRKAILQQAVHCSLDNTPDNSTMSHVLGLLTPMGSPVAQNADTPRAGSANANANAAAAAKIGQKITVLPTSSPTPTPDVLQTPPNSNPNSKSHPQPTSKTSKHARQKSASSHASASTSKKTNGLNLSLPTPDSHRNSLSQSRTSTYMRRAETPSGPMTPLGPPPPRRGFMHSGSGSRSGSVSGSMEGGGGGKGDGASETHSELLLTDLEREKADETRRTIRRTVSSPSFGEGHDYDSTASRQHGNSWGLTMVPPLPLSASAAGGAAYPRDSLATFVSSSSRGDKPDRDTSGRISADVYDHRRELEQGSRNGYGHAESLRSTMLSRPSLSEYSQASQSPTTSVFQEMLNRNSMASAVPGPSRYSFGVDVDVDLHHQRQHQHHHQHEHPHQHQQQQERMFADVDSSPEARARARAMGGTISPPPPRLSSSLAHNALPPPPRSSSFNYSLLTGVGVGVGARAGPSKLGSRVYGAQKQEAHLETNQNQNPEFHIYAPEPSSPPLPPSAALHDDLVLYTAGSGSHSNSRSVLSGIGSNTGAQESTTSFFDSIQGQPNAMDDLESSDEESGSEGGREEEEERQGRLELSAPVLRSRSRAASSASEGPARQPYPSMGMAGNGNVGMRLGNASAPYIRSGDNSSLYSSSKKGGSGIGIGNLQPVTNVVPVKTSKQDILSSSDFFRYARENPPANAATIGGSGVGVGGGGSGSGVGGTTGGSGVGTDSHRPSMSTTGHGAGDQDATAAWRSNQRAQESLRKLDGMLLKHMVDEKDTIKRIATTLTQSQAQTRSAPPSAYPF